MKRRIFSPREIILPEAKLARSAISWGKFVMPVLLTACFFVFAIGVQAAETAPKIIIGNTSTSFSNWKLNFSWNHTVAGDSPVLLVALHTDGNYINSVSYNGQSMTLAVKKANIQSYNNIGVFIYYLANPPQGAHSITVNANNYVPIIASAATFNNCDLENPIGLAGGFYQSITPMSHATTTAVSNMMLVDAVTYNKPYTISIVSGSGQTQYFSDMREGQTNNLYSGESYKLAEQAGLQTMSWQTGDNRPSVHIIVALKPKYVAPAEPDPVILVPGIMGSWPVLGVWQVDPIFHTYDNLIAALISAGYKEPGIAEPKGNLFTFPYDWRADNNITANLLKEKIQEVKTITGASKVDIIAHSMGGLVARSYIEGSDYQNDVDQVVFLGTPHQGSVESYLRYEGAIFTGTLSWLQKYYFQTEATANGYLDLTDYIRVKVPTVEQLLPTFSYLKDKQTDNSWQLRPYPLNYPQNNYLENLNSQANLDLLKQRTNITNIVSDLGAFSTINSLRVIPDSNLNDNNWQNGYPENLAENLDSLEMGNGDTTVPLSSADSINGVEVIESNSADHMNLPTIMQKEVIKILTGKMPENYYNSKITSIIKRWFFFRVYSPVDLVVTAPDGRRVGKDFINNTAVNEIPDAFYSGFDSQTEFVLIPNPEDGEYKVEVEGVDNGGEYTVAGSLINDDKENGAQFSGNIAPTEQRDFTVNYSAAAENPIGELEPVDTVPPVIIINKPLDGDKFLRNDNLILDYSVSDDFSGIAATSTKIDNQIISNNTVDLFVYTLGGHTLIINTTDKAGNQAEKQVSFTVITNIDNTIIDINKIYQKGGLSSQFYKTLLVNAFKLLDAGVKYIDAQIKNLQDSIIKTQNNSNLTPEARQKLIDQYNKQINTLRISRQKLISTSLDLIVKSLDLIKKLKLINQVGYDIIISDINYLRINL